MTEAEPTAADVLVAIDELVDHYKRLHVTRVEIARQLGVAPAAVSDEGKPTGPLLEALERGWIEPHPAYVGYWSITGDGQTVLDSGIFRS
jgi:hypothetical protein